MPPLVHRNRPLALSSRLLGVSSRGLGAVLEEKRASLLQAIEECQQERLARLSAQIQEHRSLLDGSGLVGYAQEVLKETDQPCFVQAAKQLHNRYSGGMTQGHRLMQGRGIVGVAHVSGSVESPAQQRAGP